MRQQIHSQLFKMPERTCDKCNKTYASGQSFNYHLKNCDGKKRGPGRPRKEEEHSFDEYEVSDEEGDSGDLVSVLPPKKKSKVKRLVIVSEWKSTFEKDKEVVG